MTSWRTFRNEYLAGGTKQDEVNQVLTINVWLEQEWEDERLTWDPKDYNNLKVLRIPCEKLWLPDIVLYNSADDYTTGYMNSKAMVTYTGNVFWPPPAKFRSSCKIDITYFPFDDQTCELKFGSWTYDGFQVDITNRSATVDLQNYVFSGEWELIDVRIKRMEITYACCIEPYPDVRFTIVIRRKTLYYLFNIIFPCLWLTILSLLGFWLPPDSGEKITLGITVLLAFSVFMLLIAESMPATSEFVPLIGIYLTVTMGMTSLSIILTVFVLQLHHVGPHKRPVPKWLRTIICDVFARLVCMSRESQPFSTRHHQQQYKLRRGGAAKDGIGRRQQQMAPRVVIEPSDGPVTRIYPEDNDRGDSVTGGGGCGGGGGDGGVDGSNVTSAGGYYSGGNINGGDGNSVRLSSSVSALPPIPGRSQTLQPTRPPDVAGSKATPLSVPSNQQGGGGGRRPFSSSNTNSSSCNGEASALHQRARVTPANTTNELTPHSTADSPSTGQDLQCREYAFHEQPGGFGAGISRTPSFRSRSGSSRGEQFRGSFRAGFPVVSSGPSYSSGYLDGSSAAGGVGAAYGGGGYMGAAYRDPSFESYQQLVMEWQFIAHVMDRLLFWLFLFVALVSSVAILVIKPLFKPPL